MNAIINYKLESENISNPDNSLPCHANNCQIVPGPLVIDGVTYANCLDFAPNGNIKASLPIAQINKERFVLRTIFKIDSPVTTRQNLLTSDFLPFAIYIDPTSVTGNAFKVVTSIYNKDIEGIGGASTEFFKQLSLGTWYTIDLLYDIDTLGVFVDGFIYSVHAYPNGTITTTSGNTLFVGVKSDGIHYQFNGKMASIQLYDDIFIELESQLDERRMHPEWFLTHKYELVKNKNIGCRTPQGSYYYDAACTSWIQKTESGLIMYHESNGSAFEIHGYTRGRYEALSNSQKIEIGYLVSDVLDSHGGEVSLFDGGGIYWSRNSEAHSVVGQIYIDYEHMGGISELGFPMTEASLLPFGKEQRFQKARMYYKTGSPKAFEVHGDILTKYLATGGINTWGYPVSNEEDIKNGTATIGKISEFERCTIYWKASVGAFELHGGIRAKYIQLKGPLSGLGFPTSDEGDIPGASAPARYNTFQNGSILWFGNASDMFVSMPFDIHLGTLDTVEQEGCGKGQNDIFFSVDIFEKGNHTHHWRAPADGDFGDNNICVYEQDLGLYFVPNDPNLNIDFALDVWDSDWPDGDDHLGYYKHTLSMANAWGYRENAMGKLNSGSFDSINYISWNIVPIINEELLPEKSKWWGVKNKGTNRISYEKYATAFRDVDGDPEWWDVTDWLEKAFYSLVVKGLAKGGNCFGMSLESIYSLKHRSSNALPLDRFTKWDDVESDFNIKHQYQVGSSAIWWFVAEFLSGETQDPVNIFKNTRYEYYRGSNPVICIAQNYDFSGAPHCILPVGWDDSVQPWQIKIFDPNFPSNPNTDDNPARTLYVDPDSNTFSYDGGSNKYSGGEWSGGRFHFMPYSLLNTRPRTPIWDAIMLILTGTIILLGESGKTNSLTDENGVDLSVFNADAINKLKGKKPLKNKFVPINGFNDCNEPKNIIKDPGIVKEHNRDRSHSFTSQIYMSTEKRKTGTDSFRIPKSYRSNLTLEEYIKTIPPKVYSPFQKYENLYNKNKHRLVTNIIADAKLHSSIDSKVGELIEGTLDKEKNFVHKFKSVTNCPVEYIVKHKLNQFSISYEANVGEEHYISARNLGSQSSVLNINASKDKNICLQIHNRIGIGDDYFKIKIEKIPLISSANTSINIKPGFSGVEILCNGQQFNTIATFELHIQDQILQNNFLINESEGIRIIPSILWSSNQAQIKLSKINTLFGNTLNSKILLAI